MREITYATAIREALVEEMERDANVLLLGEDIGVYGGAFGVTRGLREQFGPSRVIDTPISEGSFVGVGVGASLLGLRPVVEIMFMDFIALAADQIVNHAAKFREIYGEQARVPLVIRTAAGGGRRYGATHSQSLEAWFMHTPGLTVVAPGTPADAKGLLKSAIRADEPVIFIESKALYPVSGPVPEGEQVVPLGQARVAREGADLTVVTYGRMVAASLQAAETLAADGISTAVVDLRTLKPLDMDTVVKSVRGTGRVLIVHEACAMAGPAAEIGFRIFEEAFDCLDAPIRRLTAPDAAIPFGPALEDAFFPSAERIVTEARRLVRGE
jgi:pyruvate/2-oxoglutarate/acetoin dehydrogenase E1 component